MTSSKRGPLDDPYSQRPMRSLGASSAIGGEDILAKYNTSSRYNTSSSGLSSSTAVATESARSLLTFNDSSQQQVGYANLPNQIYRRAIRRGFEFNLMVVGETGLGKSTLLNSLFLSELYNAEHPGPSKRIKKTVYVESHTVLLKENSVHLRLNLIDTPGFGDAVDNSNCWCPVIDFIEARFEDHLIAEQKVNRGQILDSRVHCILYFIAPTGHGLKPLDIEFLKRLSDKANIVPVIAKADSMTPEELRDFKKTILNELAQHKIRVYDFPDCPGGDSINSTAAAAAATTSTTSGTSSTASTLSSVTSFNKDDDSSAQLVKIYRERMPFAVIGANCTVEGRSGIRTRGRVYPWGAVEIENLEHNDFKALRNLLLRTHMQDLREVTSNLHYENYRFSKLSGIAQESNFSTTDGKDPMTQMEAEKREREFKLRKMETEMESVFEMKVKEKKQKLKESEQDLQRRADQMRRQLEQQEAELSERRRQFEAEKLAWEKAAASDATLPYETSDSRWQSLEHQPQQQQQSSEKIKSKSKRFAFIK